MCIAIYNPKGITIKKKVLKRCWKSNPDGGGMMYARNNTVYTYKVLNSFNDWYKKYKELHDKYGKESDFVLHFRIATHGKIDIKNTHPHIVGNGLAFVHNGIIDIETTKEKSDTICFNEKILQKLPADFLKSEPTRELISGYIGSSKLVFLNAKGEHTIINEHLGEWVNGVWYSNGGYKERTTYAVYNYGYGKSKSNNYYDKFFNEEGYDDYIADRCYYCDTPLKTEEEKEEGACKVCMDSLLKYGKGAKVC